jgi:hypothetical protein
VACAECGAPVEKTWTHCEDCRNKRAIARWAALPFKEWDGKTAICTWDGDKFFFSEDDLIEWLYDNEFNGCDVMLVSAVEITYPELDVDYFSHDAHEDWEPQKELLDAIEKLNEVVRKFPAHSYTVGKIRTSYEYTYNPNS